jgi:hypothetical protein
MADWSGKAQRAANTADCRPARHVFAWRRHAGPVLEPGSSRTKTGRFVDIRSWRAPPMPMRRCRRSATFTARTARSIIRELYDIERVIRGSPLKRRLAVRQEQSTPRFNALRKWLDETLLECRANPALRRSSAMPRRWRRLPASSMMVRSRSTTMPPSTRSRPSSLAEEVDACGQIGAASTPPPSSR